MDHKYEGVVGTCRRFWREIAERAYHQGLHATEREHNPYPRTSFSGIHWLRGANDAAKQQEI
jgi:hypothetical protein